MKIAAIISLKGGSGKSTLTCNLAVYLNLIGKQVGLVDLNYDQASTSQWWVDRGKPDNPKLYDEYTGTDIRPALEQARKEGCEYLLIDTSPIGVEVASLITSLSDVVLVPMRGSKFNTDRLEEVLDLAELHGKSAFVILSDVDATHKAFNAERRKTLTEFISEYADDIQLLEASIGHRVSYMNAETVGKAGVEENKQAKADFAAIWSEIEAGWK